MTWKMPEPVSKVPASSLCHAVWLVSYNLYCFSRLDFKEPVGCGGNRNLPAGGGNLAAKSI